ncbi:acyl-CoA dehydrogenase NM domain-like protein [Crucibulum laeve]|uniref:Acyl-CoA dehydrogenase NM domain-like protein n=1 Tax=Crucibulum laeve TaxID=68775 RepID=A0A5C3LDD4_9AGAR|nr:acyl-CoA dehydrogenase NM domain-like protein [Crucibulum laeve]
MWPTSELALTPLWRIRSEALPFNERVQLSYQRCRSVVQTYRLTSNDIVNVSPMYWKFYTDPILMMDCAVAILLTIHYNLCTGTLAMYSSDRPDIARLVEKLLKFEISGQYCLTELGHGLDIFNMESTAKLLSNGEFELNTGISRAAKYMPPTSPCGIPVVAIVFARLIVDETDRGIKPFVVYLSDGSRMNKGITCKVTTVGGGSQSVKHALTSFDHVRLPRTALLGSIEKAQDARGAFYKNIYRVITGSLSVGALGLSAMRVSSYIVGSYSQRRHVIDSSTGISRPIITFSTQYIPILTAISQTFVMEAFANKARRMFLAPEATIFHKHFIASIFKATISRFAKSIPIVLGDRYGAQGLNDVNQLTIIHANARGGSIAEGDILTTSIRFGVEVILGRIAPPPTVKKDSLLWKHERSAIAELGALMRKGNSHRDSNVARQILPQCQPLIEAIGHRMAYDSAIEAGLDERLIQLFISSVMKFDPAWYSENENISRAQQAMMDQEVATALLPDINDFLDGLRAKDYITAPIPK